MYMYIDDDAMLTNCSNCYMYFMFHYFIFSGDHHMSNVVSLHQGQKLTCYASLLVEFGLIGDMMHDCEKYRLLGPTRYSGESLLWYL